MDQDLHLFLKGDVLDRSTASSCRPDNVLSETLKEFLTRYRGRKTFLEHEVKGLLSLVGLTVPKGIFAGRDGKIPTLNALKFPLVAKISSTAIASKSDIHGVRMGLRNYSEVEEAVRKLSGIAGAEGVLIEEMALPGVEVIVGGVLDKQFGPVVMFGLGGTFVELFKDVAFGLAPLGRETALWLIKQVKGYRLLEQYRGRPKSDIDALTEVVCTVSGLMATGLIEEIDLNPVAVYPRGAVVLDAKMVLAS